jgi:hypothetical protein
MGANRWVGGKSFPKKKKIINWVGCGEKIKFPIFFKKTDIRAEKGQTQKK